jgi:hypothetical protein
VISLEDRQRLYGFVQVWRLKVLVLPVAAYVFSHSRGAAVMSKFIPADL